MTAAADTRAKAQPDDELTRAGARGSRTGWIPIAQAQEHAGRIVADAQNRAKAIRQDARAHADAIVARARTIAGQAAPAAFSHATVHHIDAGCESAGPRHAAPTAPPPATARTARQEVGR